ncbi:hypothetical protein [Kosmotoga pacifica]|nr:hypothetical protein [Kosmotoga pacifica]
MVILFAILLGSALLYFFPIKPLPAPDGEYKIGLRILELKMLKKELATDNPDDRRRILIDIWYPAEETSGYEPSYWLREPTYFKAMEGTHDILKLLTQHAGQVRTNSYINAPTKSNSGNGYPVIILLPGTPSLVSLYFNYAEKLASHGYIVVGLEQTYANIAVEFADETVIFDRSTEATLIDRISKAETEDERMQDTFQYPF